MHPGLRLKLAAAAALAAGVLAVIGVQGGFPRIAQAITHQPPGIRPASYAESRIDNGKLRAVLDNAHAQIGKTVVYDPAYRELTYPGGDVPIERGVCTDVVIRALRAAHLDLQKAVHEDMLRAFDAYPKKWGLRRPNSHIDHRRVPNLQTYFERKKQSLPISMEAKDYLPGDLVTWKLNSGLDHIGIVSNRSTADGRPLIVHNIGAGAQLEDVLFGWAISGHYRPTASL